MGWLEEPVNQWQMNAGFQELKIFVDNLAVVNDCSERAIKMISDIAMILTSSSQNRRALIECVERNRAEFAGFDKGTLNK